MRDLPPVAKIEKSRMGANPNSHTVRQSFPTDEGVVTTPKIGIIIRKSANRWARNVFFSTDCDFFRMKMCGNKKYVYICSPKTKVLVPGGRGRESFSRDRKRRDAGVVDRAALEMRCTGNCTGGSNPSLSANKLEHQAITENTHSFTHIKAKNCVCFYISVNDFIGYYVGR